MTDLRTPPHSPPRTPTFTALLRASLIVCGGALAAAGLAWLVARWLGVWSQR